MPKETWYLDSDRNELIPCFKFQEETACGGSYMGKKLHLCFTAFTSSSLLSRGVEIDSLLLPLIIMTQGNFVGENIVFVAHLTPLVKLGILV